MTTPTHHRGEIPGYEPGGRATIRPEHAEWTHPLVLHDTGDGEVGATVLVAGEDTTAWSLLDARMATEATGWLLGWLAAQRTGAALAGAMPSHAARAERDARPALALYSALSDRDQAEDQQTYLADLIADLLHLAGPDPDAAERLLDRARAIHAEDQHEDGNQ